MSVQDAVRSHREKILVGGTACLENPARKPYFCTHFKTRTANGRSSVRTDISALLGMR
jgi:hypothetical protein